MAEFNNEKIPLIAVVGPTASGKTALGVYLAKRFNGEVISADSMQIYKGMEIASAKATKEEMEDIPHYLLDFKDPEEAFSVAEYTKLAHQAAREIYKKGKQPIVVGGTGLYIDSFLNNIQFDTFSIDETYQQVLAERMNHGEEKILLAELKKVDPALGEKLHESDHTRIIRGLAVYQATGKPLSLWQKESRAVPSPYNVIWIGLTTKDRQKLYDRINDRVDLMMEKGLLEEARSFWRRSTGKTASAAIGHKEFFPYFESCISLEEAIEKLKQNTRRYAKRQLTWFRRNQKIHWLYIDQINSAELMTNAEKIVVQWREEIL